MSVNYLRGTTVNVKDCSNNPMQIIEKAGLNWNAGLIPLQSIDGHLYDGKCGIRNDSNLKFIDSGKPVSSKFKLHDHKEILADFCRMADDSGLSVTHAGSLHGGEHVILTAELPKKFEIKNKANKVGDIVGANIVFDISYTPGVVSKALPQALRLVCLNGMKAAEAINAEDLHLTHRKEYKHEERRNLQAQFDAIAEKVGNLVESLSTLNNIDVSQGLSKAFVVNTLQPTLLDAVIEETINRGYITHTTHKWGYLELLQQSEPVVEMLLNSHIKENANRQVKSLLEEIIFSQEGGEFTDGTLGHAYNALTYQIDHVRGRGADAAVEYSLFGQGSKVKTEALNLGMEYVKHLGVY